MGNLKNKRIIVLGGLGLSERRDRDPDRILDGGGALYTLPSHAAQDKPLVIRKYDKHNRSGRQN